MQLSGRERDQRAEGLGFPGRKAEGKERGGRGEKVLKLLTLRTYRVFPERLERWMAHQLRAFAALPKDVSSDPSTYIWQLMTASKSSSKRSNVLFWQPSTHTDTHMHK